MICLIREKRSKEKKKGKGRGKESETAATAAEGVSLSPRVGRGEGRSRPGLAACAGPAPGGNGRTRRASRALFTAAQPMGGRGARAARPMGGRCGAFERRGASAGACMPRRGPCAARHARPPRRLRGAAHHRRRLLREVPQGSPQGRRQGEEKEEAAGVAQLCCCRASLPDAGGSRRHASERLRQPLSPLHTAPAAVPVTPQGVSASADLGMEGAGLWRDDGVGEADARVGGEPAEGAAAPEHRAVLRSHHRQEQHHPVHHHGVLRWGRPGQLDRQVRERKAREMSLVAHLECLARVLGSPERRETYFVTSEQFRI